MIGRILSHYRVLEKIGEGGMGEVYLAKDTKLDREVAIKVLPQAFSENKQRLARFEREARILASLNHPNIAAIHELEETDGVTFLALEYVPGETLAGRIKRGPIPIDEALFLFKQIAGGLEAAHENEIIHRDLKPSNIKVTPEGKVKVLDFGLAKALSGEAVVQNLSESPTVTRAGTGTGVLLGTAPYMSPEQARGKVVDKKADIWAFGCILYETLTGKAVFLRDTLSDTIAAVLGGEPTWRALPRRTPAPIRSLVRRCLQKDSQRRLHDIADARIEIEDSLEQLSSSTIKIFRQHVLKQSRRGFLTRARLASALAFVLLLVAAFYYLASEGKSPKTQSLASLTLKQLSSGVGLSGSPSWSPDGAWIAYASNENGSENMDIWKAPLDIGQPVQITDTSDNENHPAWSPDGRTIAFSSDREGSGIYLTPSDGGTPWRLTDFGTRPTWSPDGKTLAFEWHGNIFLVPATGGDANLLVAGTVDVTHAVWGPNSDKLIYWNRVLGDIYFVSVPNGESEALGLTPTGQEVSGLAWSHDGQSLVFSRGPFGGDKNLWKVAIDPDTGHRTADPIPFLVSVTEDIDPVFSPDDSKVAFTARQMERHLWAIPIDSSTGLADGDAYCLTTRGRQNYYPALSPDGQRLVWTSHQGDQGLLYLRDLDVIDAQVDRKVTSEWGRLTREVGASFAPDSRQLSFSSTIGGSYQIWRLPSLGSVALQRTETQKPVRDVFPAWSPRDSMLVFYSNRGGNWDIWSFSEGIPKQPKQLTNWSSDEMFPVWSPDGRFLAFRTDKEGNPDIWIMDGDGTNPHPYVTHPSEEGWSAWSPNGRWFYFTSNRSSTFNIWVKPSSNLEAFQVTFYQSPSFGLPETALYTRFAVSASALFVPLESRKGDIYLLEDLSSRH